MKTRYVVVSTCEDENEVFFDVVPADSPEEADERVNRMRDYAVLCAFTRPVDEFIEFAKHLADGTSEQDEAYLRSVECPTLDKLTRDQCVELLEGYGIECQDDEPVDVLREAIAVNVADGTIDKDDVSEMTA